MEISELPSIPTLILYNPICLKHLVPPEHHEQPERLVSVMTGVRSVKEKYPNSVVVVEDFEPVHLNDLLLAHSVNYYKKLERSVPTTDEPQHITQYSSQFDTRSFEDFDTFMSSNSLKAALYAAGSVCKAVDSIMSGEYRHAFCVVRPPGHHCGKSGHATASSQGYCILNNVAIGGLYAKEKYNLERIAIVDFDVHHGNGTEEVLGSNSNFLFISIHVGNIYPFTGKNGLERPFNVMNISLRQGEGSKKFHKAFDRKIIPMLDKYEPQLLFISAGFDGHKEDPTQALNLLEKDYFLTTEKLKAIANKYCEGKIISVLEGGYDFVSLQQSAKEHLLSLIKK